MQIFNTFEEAFDFIRMTELFTNRVVKGVAEEPFDNHAMGGWFEAGPVYYLTEECYLKAVVDNVQDRSLIGPIGYKSQEEWETAIRTNTCPASEVSGVAMREYRFEYKARCFSHDLDQKPWDGTRWERFEGYRLVEHEHYCRSTPTSPPTSPRIPRLLI